MEHYLLLADMLFLKATQQKWRKKKNTLKNKLWMRQRGRERERGEKGDVVLISH